MRVWETIEGWPLGGWTVGPYPGYDEVARRGNPGELQLEAFAGPDSNGWFNVVAVDSGLHEWSNLFRVDDTKMHDLVQEVLANCIGRSLNEVGEVELNGILP